MNTTELKSLLEPLTTSQLKRLSEVSEVGLRTIWQIRGGFTVTAGEATKEKLAHGLRRLARASKEQEDK